MQDQQQTTDQTGSLLSDAQPSAFGDWRDTVADKFKANGEVNHEAIWQSYQHAEKRIGSGDIPPKDAASYAPQFAEGFDPEPYKELVDGFREKAHAAGMTNTQFNAVLNEFLPSLSSEIESHLAEVAPNPARAEAELRQAWPDEKTYKNNVMLAKKAFEHYADKEMLIDDIGNNPTAIKLLAKLGAGLKEDSPINHAAIMPQESVKALMASPAYVNPNHPEHAMVHARVKAHYANAARQ